MDWDRQNMMPEQADSWYTGPGAKTDDWFDRVPGAEVLEADVLEDEDDAE